MLAGLRADDGSARERLLPLVYEELPTIARQQLGRKAAETITALVHEAYLKRMQGHSVAM